MVKLFFILITLIFFCAHTFSQEGSGIEEYNEYHYDENHELREGSGENDFFIEDEDGNLYFCPVEEKLLIK